MTQPRHSTSPLTARLYDLEYPRSLGVYSTYQEVQAVVDTLADNHFPVQSTLIVGTDLKLMERVTGRKTWGRVVGQGVLSGLWMGLFLGLLLMLITPSNLMVVLTSVLMGIVFFTVWALIGYAMTGGKRDFTSMTSTIPMQYELLVEHKHADQARRLLAETGAAPVVAPHSPTIPLPGHGGPGAYPGPAQPTFPDRTPPTYGGNSVSQHQQAPTTPPTHPEHTDAQRPSRPTYGKPVDSAPQPTADSATSRSGRPAFGRPAGAALYEGTPVSGDPQHPAGGQSAASPSAPRSDRPAGGYPEQPEDDQSTGRGAR